MYSDHRPPNSPSNCPKQVLVLEVDKDKPYDVEEVIATAREIGAVTKEDGVEIFWTVYDDDPRRAWDHTERALRSELKS